jgi:hypothetical protein
MADRSRIDEPDAGAVVRSFQAYVRQAAAGDREMLGRLGRVLRGAVARRSAPAAEVRPPRAAPDGSGQGPPIDGGVS